MEASEYCHLSYIDDDSGLDCIDCCIDCLECRYYYKDEEEKLEDCILENGEYCWQRCVATEHCGECKCLGNGDINYFS